MKNKERKRNKLGRFIKENKKEKDITSTWIFIYITALVFLSPLIVTILR